MKSNFLYTTWSTVTLLVTCLVGVITIAGCGVDLGLDGTGGTGSSAGVGTGGTGGISLSKASVSGVVSDANSVNIAVFLDKNGNYQVDADEPSTKADATGAYQLEVPVADIGVYPLVALAIKKTTVYKSAAESSPTGYLFSIPKEAVSDSGANFISPLTSLLREMMETGKYTSLQQAAEALRVQMGLPAGTDIFADYTSTSNTTVHAAAANIATLIENKSSQILGTDGMAITVDVNRYRAIMGLIVSYMPNVTEASAQVEMRAFDIILNAVLSMPPPKTK